MAPRGPETKVLGRSFKFCTPESKCLPPDDRPVWFGEVMELLRDILCKCQETLLELSIDVRMEMLTGRFLADGLSVLFGEHRIRFRNLRALCLNTSILEYGSLKRALLPPHLNLRTLSVLGDMAKSIAADREMYSSVKYLSIGDQGMGFAPRVIEAIVGRFVGLESLMLNGSLIAADQAARDGVYRVRYAVLCTWSEPMQLTPLPQTIREHCPSLKQFAIQRLYWDDLESLARLYFATMPQLVLLQGLKTNADTWGRAPMARRMQDGKPAFSMRRIQHSDALARFQYRSGRDSPIGWDESCEYICYDVVND